jgi:hypothetical protein
MGGRTSGQSWSGSKLAQEVEELKARRERRSAEAAADDAEKADGMLEDMKPGSCQLWVDKYAPRSFLHLLSDEVNIAARTCRDLEISQILIIILVLLLIIPDPPRHHYHQYHRSRRHNCLLMRFTPAGVRMLTLQRHAVCFLLVSRGRTAMYCSGSSPGARLCLERSTSKLLGRTGRLCLGMSTWQARWCFSTGLLGLERLLSRISLPRLPATLPWKSMPAMRGETTTKRTRSCDNTRSYSEPVTCR